MIKQLDKLINQNLWYNKTKIKTWSVSRFGNLKGSSFPDNKSKEKVNQLT